jgi:hypothetical protein
MGFKVFVPLVAHGVSSLWSCWGVAKTFGRLVMPTQTLSFYNAALDSLLKSQSMSSEFVRNQMRTVPDRRV